MADDLNRQFDELIRKLRELGASTREIDSMRASFNSAAGDIEQGRVELERMRREVNALEAQAAAATIPFSDLTQILAANAAELQSTGQFIAKVGRSFEVVKNIGRDLLNDSMGITDLSRSQLESKIETLKIQRQSLRLASQEAAAELRALEAAIARRGGLEQATRAQQTQLRQLQAIIDYNADQDTGLAGIIEKTEYRLELEDRIEKRMGVTGALVEGTGALMERLGMRSGIFHTAMERAAQQMRNMSRATEEGVEHFSRLQIISKGLNILFSGFSKAIFSLEGAGVAIAQAFLDVNKAATETVQLTGQNAVFTQGLNTRLATTVQFLETTAELTKQTGMNAQNIFTPDVIAGAAELKNTMGLAANEAGGLAMIAQTTGKNIDATTNAIVDQTSAFNKANRSAVSQGQVLRDVATAADGIKASFAGMPGQIAKAAAAARRLGMSISELDSVASSLLNFESSIEAELEAQLLTGRQLNLSKARELALNNDLAGVGREIFKNSADLVQFGKMNRIQQEAQAKALGLTRDQLGKIAYQRALEAGMTAEQAAKAAGVNAEEMKRIAIQEKIQMLLGKLAQAFTPILEALVPIVDTFTSIIAPIAGVVGYVAQLVGKFLQLKPVAFALKAAILGIAAAKFVSFTSGIVSGIKNMAALTAQITAFNAAKAAGHTDRQILAGFAGKAAKDATQITKAQIIGMKMRNAVMNAGNKIRAVYNKLLDGSIWRAIKEKAAIVGTYIADKMRMAGQKISNAIRLISNKLQNFSILGFLKEKAALLGSTAATYASIAAQTAWNAIKKVGNVLKSISNRIQNIAILGYIKERVAVIASTVATSANTAAQSAWNAVKNFQIGTMIKSAAYWVAEKARMVADTVARWANVGATAAQTAARATQAGVNATLAGTQTAVASTGAAAGGGLAAFGAGLGAFGAAAAPAIPILLAIGATLLMASPAIAAFGYAIKSAFEGIATIITAVGGVLNTMLDKITLEKAAAMVIMGAGMISLAGGLGILTASIFTSLPAIGMLGAIALMGPGLMNAGSGIKAMAEGVAKLSEALQSLETSKLDEVKDLISSTALAAPAVAATGAITSLIQGITGEKGGDKEDNMGAKLDELIAAVRSGANVRVYLDSDDITKRTVIESTTLS